MQKIMTAILFFCFTFSFNAIASPDGDWFYTPKIYTYQSNDIINTRMGNDQAFDELLQEANNILVSELKEISPIEDERIVIAFIFNAEKSKLWAETSNKKYKKKLLKIAKSIDKKVKMRTKEGVIGFAIAISAKSLNTAMSTKAPILLAWEPLIADDQKTSATDLFNALLK